jgi:hypothetical protein
VIITKPSFIPISSLLFLVNCHATTEGIKITMNVVINILLEPSLNTKETINGINKDIEKKATRMLNKLIIDFMAISFL